MKTLSILALALIFSGRVYPADTGAFSAANRLYSEGRFADAATAYASILRTGAASPALDFNYGNAEFKLGHLGRAIAAYRRAALQAPRDPDVRANLEFVRNQVPGPTRRESAWSGGLGLLSLNEWTVLVAAAFWLTLIGLAAGQIRPAWQARWRRPTLAMAALTVAAGAALGCQAANHFLKPVAVIVAPSAIARTGPFDGAQSAFTARDGMELQVLDRHDDWVQVADGAGHSGWLPAAPVEILPGA
jgi:tetratricopeptide (TPR) repeat protein